jgi:hypothetical protein
VGLLGGGTEGPIAPTINTKIINGGPPRRQYQRSESAHHQRKKH